jgi:serpin B
VTPDERAALTDGNTAFALDLYRTLRSGNSNLFFSPYSISLALAMTYGGARSATAEQMARALHFTLPPARLHPAFNALDQELAGRAKPQAEGDGAGQAFVLKVANAMWGQRDYKFRPAFLDLLAEQYGAGMHLADFEHAPDPARRSINAWVEQQTENKIKDLLPPNAVKAATRFVLANAIYFKADWQAQFELAMTRKGSFTPLDGARVTVPMMHQTEELPYVAGDDYEAARLDYVGGASMLILLPKAGRFRELEAALTPECVGEIVGALRPERVALAMPPKFHSGGATFSLKQTLQSLGMRDAFEFGPADFSGIDGTRNLFVDDAFHQAIVIVDEQGTEAAAATGVAMAGSAPPARPPITLTIDRPFIFLIRDNATGTVLFAGRILNPRSRTTTVRLKC